MKYRTTLIIASAFAVVGCASSSSRVEDSYGDSVRSMIYNQIADPSAATNPDPEPMLGYDGSKGEKVIEQHTKNVTVSTGQPATEITQNIGK